MYILGFNCYGFNSAACLVKDGRLIAFSEEERFNRQKHTGVFPVNTIQYCLSSSGITVDDVAHVGFHMKPLHQFHKRMGMVIRHLPYALGYYNSHFHRWCNMLTAERKFREEFSYHHAFYHIKHHVCHAAGSFLVSPFSEAALLTIDGSGEMASSTMGTGLDNKINIFKEIYYPHSLGYLHVSLTHYLGFKPDCDEYKLMSLASYGEPEYYDEFKKIIVLLPDGEYGIDLSYFNYHKGIRNPWVSKKFLEIFGPLRSKEDPIEQRHKNVAWALQKRLEDTVFHMVYYLHTRTKKKNLCMAGGVALNSVLNGKLLQEGPFENIFILPAAYDAGTCVGSAFYIYNSLLNKPRDYILKNVYLGCRYSENNCREVLDSYRLPYEYLIEDALIKKTAEFLSAGKVVGWFQGGMEMGPRALGNRSILADPRRPDIKNILNAKVKRREGFRPFAPSVISEHAGEYFKCDRPSPFMLFCFHVRENQRDRIPGVVHVDGTARIQTVEESENPRYYKLIREFQKLTGIPVILNTSFNVMNEPIVCAPEDAVRCFLATDIDVLVLGNYLAGKTRAGHKL